MILLLMSYSTAKHVLCSFAVFNFNITVNCVLEQNPCIWPHSHAQIRNCKKSDIDRLSKHHGNCIFWLQLLFWLKDQKLFSKKRQKHGHCAIFANPKANFLSEILILVGFALQIGA